MSHSQPEPGRTAPMRTPRWVKVFAAIALGLVLLFIVLQIAGGDHGPGRHSPFIPAPVAARGAAMRGCHDDVA